MTNVTSTALRIPDDHSRAKCLTRVRGSDSCKGTLIFYFDVICSFQITALKIKYNPFAKAFQDAKERYVL